LVWPFERAAARGRGHSHLLRAVFRPSRAEMVRRFEIANRRIWIHYFGAVGIAASLYQISTLSSLAITVCLVGLLTTDSGIYLARRLVIRRSASNWDIPAFIAINI